MYLSWFSAKCRISQPCSTYGHFWNFESRLWVPQQNGGHGGETNHKTAATRACKHIMQVYFSFIYPKVRSSKPGILFWRQAIFKWTLPEDTKILHPELFLPQWSGRKPDLDLLFEELMLGGKKWEPRNGINGHHGTQGNFGNHWPKVILHYENQQVQPSK